ncbi:glycoside hydrolase family 24 protein [Enterobacter hormaechei]|uniref:glycoside hydrolase family 24 protein n=1 Tax=Enterobacter hormaechei TaxID=158836 RepID=UPI0007B3F4C1|nr:glycoside hydrolase family 104 protein [Enterobacter hormaechei]KZP84560.1 lysozyme [Enterobacter hormaechei subsp. xiangfangensis]RTM57071.1 lysozyme [Enterobacter hormaechei subsp. xiangfangensis]
MHPNLRAVLDTISVTEGTSTHRLTQNNGYDVIVTGMDKVPEVFTDYSDHPFAKGRPGKVFNKAGQRSTASGRYQFLVKDWSHYRAQLGLKDFGPESQDKWAVQLIKERRAIADIVNGNIESAIKKICNIWASLPGAGYGQHEFSMEKVVEIYKSFGGSVAG